ncbi:rho guanine nucleotide exchange factor 19 isoform X2 [Hemicordylus capensis]|uniref:rho guanine nucleotide exchange factor 19 isoform X2 n=1 Tax=Hemicordylus capensis TaxID=884348 RepID=UPI002302E1AE|nr:rho guanine nucleotide exchange factor 19 isoform X2 [Hemicordylus capensis]
MEYCPPSLPCQLLGEGLRGGLGLGEGLEGSARPVEAGGAACTPEGLPLACLGTLPPPRQRDGGVFWASPKEGEGLPFPEAPHDNLQGHPSIGDPRQPASCQSPDEPPAGGPNCENWSFGPRPGTAGLSVPQGRQVAGKADSWPHRAASHPSSSSPSSHSDPSLHQGVLGGPWSPTKLPESQRRASLGAGPEKKAWRKLRLYAPEGSPSGESFSGPSLDREGITTSAGRLSLEDALRTSALPSALQETTEGATRPAGDGPPPPGTLSLALPRGSAAGWGSGGQAELGPQWCFSEMRMMGKLQLTQGHQPSPKLGQEAGQVRTPTNSITSECSHTLASALPDHKGNARSNSALEKEEEEEESEVHHNRMAPHEKRCSRFLPNSVLYQEYSAAATNREIQRQQREDAPEEEEGGEEALGPSRSNLSPSGSFCSRRSSGGSTFSLWQEIPNVRSSGLLGTISMQACKLQEAKFELITSEASYLHSLSIVVSHFMNSRELDGSLSTQEKQWLFSKLPEVKDVSERFLQDLEQRLEEDILRFEVCDIVLRHCPAFRRVYLPYVTNQAYQEQTYQRLLLENSKFPGILAKLEEAPVCQRLPLASFLILPFQRVTRLKMVVENILKRTLQSSPDEELATKAFSELKRLVRECNTSVQSMKRTEELIHLSQKIHFESKSRWLVKHGELVEVDIQVPSASSSKLKLSAKMVYLHLFNDCLLLSRKKETGKFAVFVHAKMPELRVTDLSSKLHRIPGQIFLLQLLDNQQLKHQILLRAQSDKSSSAPPGVKSSGGFQPWSPPPPSWRKSSFPRRKIYALNRVMTELEQQQFDAFCKQMRASDD